MKKTFILGVVSLLLFIATLCSLFYIYEQFERKEISEAEIWICETKVLNNAIRLSWKCDNTQVTSYRVYRRNITENEEYKLLKVISNYKKFYNDTDVKLNNLYSYRVTAVNTRTKAGVDKSKPSDSVYIMISENKTPYNTENIKVKESNGILYWSSIENIALTSYGICYRSSNDDDWEIITTTSPNIFQYETNGVIGEYKIIARKKTENAIANIIESETITLKGGE